VKNNYRDYQYVSDFFFPKRIREMVLDDKLKLNKALSSYTLVDLRNVKNPFEKQKLK
jgi:hypothetical protein